MSHKPRASGKRRAVREPAEGAVRRFSAAMKLQDVHEVDLLLEMQRRGYIFQEPPGVKFEMRMKKHLEPGQIPMERYRRVLVSCPPASPLNVAIAPGQHQVSMALPGEIELPRGGGNGRVGR
jgi:hypothetical protein